MKHKGIVIKQTEAVISIACDVCGKVHLGNELPKDWLIVKFDCNYSYDEGEDEDEVCSPECYLKILQRFCDIISDESGFTINGMSVNFIENLLKHIKN